MAVFEVAVCSLLMLKTMPLYDPKTSAFQTTFTGYPQTLFVMLELC